LGGCAVSLGHGPLGEKRAGGGEEREKPTFFDEKDLITSKGKKGKKNREDKSKHAIWGNREKRTLERNCRMAQD